MRILVNESRADSVLVVKVYGDLDLASEGQFEEVVDAALAQAPVVVDLSRLDFLAASSIATLLRCRQRAQARGHDLRYAHASVQVRRLLAVADVDLADVDRGVPAQ